MIQIRYREIDILKGILTLQMILAHCLQFFLRLSPGSWQHTLSEYINLTTFSGFIFAFGFSAWHAYMTKPYKHTAPRVLTNFLRMLAAYYFSAFAFRIFIEEMPLRADKILDTLLLGSLAGWSEFLLSFAALMLCLLVLLPAMQKAGKWLAPAIALVALVACLLPAHVSSPAVAVLVGQADFPVFATIPYLVYFAAGLYLAQNSIGFSPAALLTAGASTGIFAAVLLLSGEPSRFPLSPAWLLGAALFIYGYYLLSIKMCSVKIASVLESVGQNSLFFLLTSNLLIFAIKSSRFFRLSTAYALGSFMVILAAILFLRSIISSKKH